MAPTIGKLICNNRDALHQRDEDTAAMMKLIIQKRNDNMLESDAIHEDNSSTQSTHQEEILEIAEAIRELAAKLQIRREGLPFTQSNRQLNASLTRSLEHIQKSILHTPKEDNKKSDSLAQKNLLDAYSRLKSSQDEEWLLDIVTPKAGNLTLLEEKTPLHSNISRNKPAKMKDRVVPHTGVHRNPYPLTSNKPVPKIDTISDSLATLRNELAKAKTMESDNDNHKINIKKHPFSTKNQRSLSRSRTEASLERSSSNGRHTNLFIDATSKSIGKIRSLSTGRAAQHGKQIINRILRREPQDDDADEKTLTAASSDSTHEPVPVSRREKDTTTTDLKVDIIVNRHHKSAQNGAKNDDELDYRKSEKNHIFRRSGTPRRVVERSASNQRQNRPTTPFRSTQPSRARQPIKIDASMSNVSMTSAYLASDTAQCPMKYRSIKNNAEKGFEIVMPDESTPKIDVKSDVQSIRSSRTDSESRTSHIIDRTAISQRLQHHQKYIKEKIRKDLNVTTDLRDDHDSVFDKVSTTKTTTTKSECTNIDSTRAVLMRDDKIMNDRQTSSTSSHYSSSTSSSDTNTTTAVKKRTTQTTKAKRSIIRE